MRRYIFVGIHNDFCQVIIITTQVARPMGKCVFLVVFQGIQGYCCSFLIRRAGRVEENGPNFRRFHLYQQGVPGLYKRYTTIAACTENCREDKKANKKKYE